MASNADKRAAMFRRGSLALARTFPDAPSGYVCPLCIGLFDEAALRAGKLTLEDAPPASIGGRPVCLTCVPCNNRSGSELDHHMTKAERLIDFQLGRDVELPGRTSVLGVEQPGRLSMRAGMVVWEGNPIPAQPPLGAENFINVMDYLVSLGEDASGVTFTTMFDVAVDERRLRIGWMRTAYLVAFAALGYRYISNPSFAAIRAQIADPSKDGFIAPIVSSVDAPRDQRMLFVTHTPVETAGLYVVVGKRAIWLPHPDDHNYLERAAAFRGSHAQLAVTGDEIPWPTKARFMLDVEVHSTRPGVSLAQRRASRSRPTKRVQRRRTQGRCW